MMVKPTLILLIILLMPSIIATKDAQSATPAVAPVEGSIPAQKDVSKLANSTPTPSGADDRNNALPSFRTLSVVGVSPDVAALGQEVLITLNNDPTKSSLTVALTKDNIKAADLELIFNGIKIAKGATPGKDTGLYFQLPNESETIRKLWNIAGTEEKHDGLIKGDLTVSLPGGSGRLDSSVKLTLKLYESWRLGPSWIILGVLLVVFILLAKTSDIVRDRAVAETNPTSKIRRPYSLARCQMAFWTFIILSSYLFIYAIMCDPRAILNQQALILLGIGVGTSMFATIIEGVKEETNGQKLAAITQQIDSLEAEAKGIGAEIYQVQRAAEGLDDVARLASLQALTPLQSTLADKRARLQSSQTEKKALASQTAPLTSKGLLMDLLTDASGVSIHRFQMLAWTLVVGFVFLAEVMVDLVMPDLDPMLLALMGISAATYAGFKIPEKQMAQIPEKQVT